MDNASINKTKKRSRNKKRVEKRQLDSSIERKTSGYNWETYKNLFSRAKSEESNGEKIASQNRQPKPKNPNSKNLNPKNPNPNNPKSKNTKPKNLTNPLQKTLSEENNEDNAAKNKENMALTEHIAMDCEMVGVGDGTESMIARVSIVNKYGNCIYDKYVKPREKVVDYRTAVSGIRPEDLQDGEDFNIVQKEVADILKGRFLIGHALKHDLSVLYLSHPRRLWRDTSRYKPFRQISKGNTPSLKKLAHELLGKEIQVGEHSSVEDAKAAMHLYMLYRRKWESDVKRKGRW